MRDIHSIDEYDVTLLREARQRIMAVYTYHYGDSKMRTEIRRLEAIINKIDLLLISNNHKTEPSG